MNIKCKATNRFLFKINIEEYYNNLKRMGVEISTPLIVEIPCRKCQMIEVYEIYPHTYKHKSSYKFDRK